MDRSDFLKFVATTPFASLLSFDNGEPKPKSEEAKENLEELYNLIKERKPITICGVEFIMTELVLENNRPSRSITMELQSTKI